MPTVRVHTKAARYRLEKLIERRLECGADKAAIDAQIWDLFGETWAVMFTDLAGFSRNTAEFGIIQFLQTIQESHRLLLPVIEQHSGILVKIEADSMLLMFRRPERAISCAIEMQRVLDDYNRDKERAEEVLLCLGLGYGPMLRIGDYDIFGAELNAASKLGEDVAAAHEILVTDSFKCQIEGVMDLGFEELDFVPPGAAGAYRVHYSQ